MRFQLDSLLAGQLSPDPLGGIASSFRKGSALVDAALGGLLPAADELERARSMAKAGAARDGASLRDATASIRACFERAAIDGDNLLVEDVASARRDTLLVFALTRQASGALTTQNISIEREPLLMIGVPARAPRAFDRLEAVVRDTTDHATARPEIGHALSILQDKVAAAISRLSIVKSRLDLQASFVTSVAEADTMASLRQIDIAMDQDRVRDLARETRRLLSRQQDGPSNGLVLTSLFARHAAESESEPS